MEAGAPGSPLGCLQQEVSWDRWSLDGNSFEGSLWHLDCFVAPFADKLTLFLPFFGGVERELVTSRNTEQNTRIPGTWKLHVSYKSSESRAACEAGLSLPCWMVKRLVLFRSKSMMAVVSTLSLYRPQTHNNIGNCLNMQPELRNKKILLNTHQVSTNVLWFDLYNGINETL